MEAVFPSFGTLSKSMGNRLLGFLFHLQRKFRVDIPAIVAGTVGQFRIAALRTSDIMNRPQCVVRAALALARLAVFLNRQHEQLQLISKPHRREAPIYIDAPLAEDRRLYPPIGEQKRAYVRN